MTALATPVIFGNAVPRWTSHQERIEQWLNRCVSAIRLNSVTREVLAGKIVVVKRRNWFGRHVMGLANWFLRVVGTPVSFGDDKDAWRRTEVECFNKLNTGYHARPYGADAVCEDVLPGKSLWAHLQQRTLTSRMLVAAARELRRAHGLWSDVHGGGWSHGDAAMRNVLYDPQTGRARLIDFELRHNADLPTAQRQAEDLQSFLLDLLSMESRRRWLAEALTFLAAYGDVTVIRELRLRLAPPTGLGRLWWMIRTNCASNGKIKRGLTQLQHALDQEFLSLEETAVATLWRFHQANPSANCHARTPGTPNANSRTRRISAKARQSAGAIPRSPPIST
jgi:hypothetical protein